MGSDGQNWDESQPKNCPSVSRGGYIQSTRMPCERGLLVGGLVELRALKILISRVEHSTTIRSRWFYVIHYRTFPLKCEFTFRPSVFTLLYVIRKLATLGSWPPWEAGHPGKLATLGSWPLAFCSCLYCTKYQKNHIIGKPEIRLIELIFFRTKKAFNLALQTSKCSYLGNTALLTCSHNATSTSPASQMQNHRSLNPFFCTFKI